MYNIYILSNGFLASLYNIIFVCFYVSFSNLLSSYGKLGKDICNDTEKLNVKILNQI